MRFFAFVVALLTLAAGSAHAQTVTTTDALGETVVEFITIDQNLGLPTTEILQTLTATTTTTTAPDGQQGPVGQPEPTTDDGSPTVYTYTTTDALGDLTAVVDTFTPTFLTTSTWLSAPAGTILDYTAWRSEVGTNTVAPSISAARVRWKVESGWLGIAASLLAGVAGGAWLALA
ncbi:hypothetical protein PYCCODRAFT_1439236 [Trametes coccinea BRFM310]|uniref:Uncharacterized protein n=1 Tax=Trametes coccinea (strain BRFM310) TaxID=1353009 RepID=A0A1Y2IBM1_TRAC3|nr:hypothetical protein PYCCODRAFT_1439236 [Trametes coccinea BRFM310]